MNKIAAINSDSAYMVSVLHTNSFQQELHQGCSYHFYSYHQKSFQHMPKSQCLQIRNSKLFHQSPWLFMPPNSPPTKGITVLGATDMSINSQLSGHPTAILFSKHLTIHYMSGTVFDTVWVKLQHEHFIAQHNTWKVNTILFIAAHKKKKLMGSFFC